MFFFVSFSGLGTAVSAGVDTLKGFGASGTGGVIGGLGNTLNNKSMQNQGKNLCNYGAKKLGRFKLYKAFASKNSKII